ncbi:hypothetical protein [Pseudomonas sp. B392_1p]|uniref:hypothetical protein n=1 Tax=Pseudomonas sp. B392_1p TaxID=3457507 RepID=UPI003FD52E23
MIEAYNEAGYKIFGIDFANLCFYGKGRLAADYHGVPVPMAAGGSFNFYRSSGPMYEREGRIHVNSAPGAGWLEYWSFGPVSPAPFTGGVEVYSPDGELTFNTARPLLRVRGRVDIMEDNYIVTTKQGMRAYMPFDVQTEFSGEVAFAIGNTRVYVTSQQFVNPQTGARFTDQYRGIRAMHMEGGGLWRSAQINTSVHRFSGGQGNYNYSPNGEAPLTMLVADVSGL